MAEAPAKPKPVRRRAPDKASAKAQRAVSPEDFERVIRWITTVVLVERDVEMRVLIRGALAGVNIHFIGEPGIAKSLSLREFAKCIVDAVYFEKQVHAQMPADALIGGYDPKTFVETGQLERNVTGKMPMAHIPFIDEIPRANGPTHDSILSLMNTQERQYESNGHLGKAECRFVVTASNTWFDADNQQAQALSHRITLMLKIEDIKSDDSFKELMRRDHMRRIGDASLPPRETITLAQLDAAQAQVQHVTLSPEYLDAQAKLRRDCKQEGLRIQPRAWIELGLVARANAWMAGRDHTIAEDLAIVEHGLWRDQDDIAIAHKLVLPFHGRFEREASAKRQEAAKPLAAVEKIRPKVEGTPPDQELEQPVLTEAIAASRQIDHVKSRVDQVLAEADKEKRDAAALRELSNELLATQMWFKANALPTGLDRT
jgi:MoxR-like ATPase